jgi:hypothetical protein
VTRLRVTDAESDVLTRVGVFLGRMAGQDLAQRCRDGLDHDAQSWANRGACPHGGVVRAVGWFDHHGQP